MRTSVPPIFIVTVAAIAVCAPSTLYSQDAQPHLLAVSPAFVNTENAAELVIARYKQVLLLKPAPAEKAYEKWVATLDAEGRWPDIDYSDQQPAVWKTSEHLLRVKTISRELADANFPVAKRSRAVATVLRALEHWELKRYKNPNWWHNDIGVPMLMRDIVVLLGDHLQGKSRESALDVLNQYGRPVNGAGANTMWQAELALIYGAFKGDSALMARSSRMIADEIKITAAEGIQSDWSFHAHKARLQQFHYGGSFFFEGARLGWQLRETPWAFPTEKLDLLADFLLQGGQWMARGIDTVPSTVDRSVSRPGALKSADVRTPLRFLVEALPQRAAELQAVLDRMEGNGPNIIGARVFPRSDFLTYHRPDFSFFLKLVSDRTLLTEVGGNGENLKGQRLSNGDHYLVRTGTEYFNLQPLWDWALLPGITSFKGSGSIQRMPFSGGITDGTSAAAAMTYVLGTGAADQVQARKFWACHGDIVIALIGDLHAAGTTEPVRTALDQSLLSGPVSMGIGDGAIHTLNKDETVAQNLRWIFHAGIGYLSLSDIPLSVRAATTQGSWSDINKSGSPTPFSQPLFTPVLEHGKVPNSQSSGYALLRADSPKAVRALVEKPSWRILRNDTNCQAVQFSDGTTMAAFYNPDSLDIAPDQSLSVERDCLILWRDGKLFVSDPRQKGGVFAAVFKSKQLKSNLPPDGTAIEVSN